MPITPDQPPPNLPVPLAPEPVTPPLPRPVRAPLLPERSDFLAGEEPAADKVEAVRTELSDPIHALVCA